MNDYDISQAFKAIENELIDSMMRNFSRHRAEETKEGYNWAQWQAEQLKSLEQYRKKNSKKFNKQFSELNGKVEEILKTARANGNAEQEAKILQAVKDGFKLPDKPSETSTAGFFKVNDRKLNALIKSTTDDLKRAETAILRMSNDKYRKAIYNAQVYANTGAGTYEKAVDMACRDMLRARLNCVEYSNGARHTLSDYADMAIRTANKRAYLYGEGEKRAEWGISTVVVNSRQGGCPDCAQYIGRVFIDDVYSNGKKSDGDYPLLSTAIAGGLFHPRCKDSTSTYYEGITTLKPVTPEEIDEMRNRETLENRQKYCKNQAEKCHRIANHSLDSDNKIAYASRAKAWQEKAEKTAEKLDETVAKSAESGIIRTTKVVNAAPVTDTWKPRPDFDSLIDDIIEFQGFNGKPTIIYEQSEFDKAVQKDHFIAERTIRATDEETLLKYNNQLKAVNGEDYFYVNCGVGGAQYGQGMYCAADYTKGKEPFEHFLHEIKEYGDGDKIENGCYSTTWMTLDPTSKILELPNGAKAGEYIPELYKREYMLNHAGDNIQDVLDYIDACKAVDNLTFSEPEDVIDRLYAERNSALSKVKDLCKEAMNNTMYLPKDSKFPIPKNPGVLAAEMGYDAINAVGHGATNSYTVVLNRTKLIIYGGDDYVYNATKVL